MWRYIALTLKHLLTTGLSIISVLTSGLVSALTWMILKGRNYSDVGVPMYENSDIATFTALLVFFIVLLGFLYTLQRTISRNTPCLPYITAQITCISLVVGFFILLDQQ